MPDYKLIKDLKEGMVLSESIINNYGQIMVPSQTKLNSKHLKLLNVWNIQGAMVISKDDDKVITISPVLRKKLRDKILSKFSISNISEINTGLLNDLIEMGIKYHAKRLKSEVNK